MSFRSLRSLDAPGVVYVVSTSGTGVSPPPGGAGLTERERRPLSAGRRLVWGTSSAPVLELSDRAGDAPRDGTRIVLLSRSVVAGTLSCSWVCMMGGLGLQGWLWVLSRKRDQCLAIYR